MANRWREQVRGLGEALLEVWRAELAALRDDYGRAGRDLGRVLAFFAVAAVFGFWAVGALGIFAFELLARWLPRWGAAAILFGLLALPAAVAGALAWRRLQRIEPPVATLERRFAEHSQWWRERVFQESERLGAGDASQPGEPR